MYCTASLAEVAGPHLFDRVNSRGAVLVGKWVEGERMKIAMMVINLPCQTPLAERFTHDEDSEATYTDHGLFYPQVCLNSQQRRW